MPKRVRIGIVGCGRAGLNHVETACRVPEVEVVALCDTQAESVHSAAKQFGISHAYTSVTEMIRDGSLQGVAVITPLDTHYAIVTEALHAGLPVLCEKPLTGEIAESHKLLDLSREKGLPVAVTYTYRFVPDMLRFKALLSTGAIGKIQELRFLNYGGSPEKLPLEPRRQHLYKNAKGLIYDCGSHAFDLLQWFVGSPPEHVSAWGDFSLGFKYPDHATAYFEFPGGIRAVYDYGQLRHYQLHTADKVSPTFFTIMASGTTGSLVWEYAAAEHKGEPGSVLTLRTSSGSQVETFPGYGKHREDQYRDFAETIRCGSLAGHFPSLEEAVAATETSCRVIEACLASRRK